jgi:hypothetical protein
VFDDLQNDLSAGLRCRLTNATTEQLISLSNLLQVVQLSDADDARMLLDGSPLSTKGAYIHIQNQMEDPHAAHIWTSQVPKKIKVFGWLVHLNKINTRANLLHKYSISSECPRCQAPVEDRTHLFFTCPHSAAVWTRLDIIPNAHCFQDIWNTILPTNLPPSIWNSGGADHPLEDLGRKK